MLDTVGPELQVVNKTEHPISLEVDSLVVLTPDDDKDATPNLLPINFHGLSKVGTFLFNIFWSVCEQLNLHQLHHAHTSSRNMNII